MNNLLNKRILIADNDEATLTTLDKVLTDQGATVTVAKWAGDAIELLARRERDIDLVVTDLRLPLLSGLTMIYCIHRMLPTLPIIALTAFGASDVKDECLRFGASASLEKPIAVSQLLAALQQVLSAKPSMPEPAAIGRHGSQRRML